MYAYACMQYICVTGKSVCECTVSSVSWHSLHAHHIALILSVGIFIMEIDH